MAVDEDFLSRLRATVTIMRPMPSVVPRGKHSYKERQPTRSVRIPERELEAINEAAALSGMSRSAFMIWCSYQTALDILRQYNEYKNAMNK